MLWMFRQSWPSGSWFVFNFYCHWSLLVLWNSNGTASFLHSKEGATQGDTLAMIAYGICILPLINNLNPEIPDVTQPWCADDARALSTFARIETYIDVLRCQGPRRRYYTKPSKNVLIVHTKVSWPERSFGYVTDLRCAREHIILGVTSVTTSTQAVGWESIRWCGRIFFLWSAKPWVNKPRRFSLQWYVKSNQRRYFYNASLGWVPRSGENDPGKLFASSFLRKDKNPFTHRKNSKYDAGQDVQTGPPESSNVRKGKMTKLPTRKRGTN